MERQSLSTQTEAWIETQRAEQHAAAENGEDDEFDPKDRRNREHVLGPLCRVKRGDDVLHNESEIVRIVGPARGEGWFLALSETPWGNYLVPYDGSYLTDRAPADPEEEPQPIYLEGWHEEYGRQP
jgi:hypothetical protein